MPLVLPALGVLSCLALMTQQEPAVHLRAALLLLLGLVLYGLTRFARRRGTAAAVPSPHDR